jgi:spore germination protein
LSVFKSNEKEIEGHELMYSVSSMILSVGVLTLPRNIASTTRFSDGWISLVLGGAISLALVWILSLLASSFPKLSYFEYTSLITTKMVGTILTGLFAVSYIMFTAYEVRSLAEVA